MPIARLGIEYRDPCFAVNNPDAIQNVRPEPSNRILLSSSAVQPNRRIERVRKSLSVIL